MDAARAVWSMKTGKLIRLSGSHTRSGRYYSLAGQTYREDFLNRMAQAHSSFNEHTRAPDILSMLKAKKASPESNDSARVHAPNFDAGIKSKGYMIATVENGRILFAKSPTIHLTQNSVEAEMERLALISPGTKFIYVKICKSVVSGGVTWE
jgi:exoribonuclease II